MELVVFVLASLMMILGAVGVVTRKNPVHAALSLVLTLFGVAVHFVALEAYFLAAVQVIVYAGAIVVLFLFVIMLLGVDKAEDIATEPLVAQRWLAGIAGLGLLGLLIIAAARGSEILTSRSEGLATEAESATGDANIQQLARSVFGDYVVAFELTSVLLVVAVVGTVMLARRRNAMGEV